MASRDIKVGLFVLVSLTVLGLLVFMIGDERKLFSERADFRAAFKDVQGLSKGSPVRMGGVDIGSVEGLGYGEKSEDDTIYVEMSIVASEAQRIRADSVAEVRGKGFLGDKMIVISVGKNSLPAMPAGSTVKTVESRDIEQIIQDVKDVSAGAQRVIANLEVTTKSLAEGEFHSDIKDTMSNISQVLETVNQGDGYLGRLLNDKAEANNISSTIKGLRRSAAELESLLASTRKVVDRVHTGPGFLHQLIYEDDGSKAISQVGSAAEEVGLALQGIRQGDSFASGILYGEESGKMVDNLNRASADISEIVRGVRDGKGTLGAFLVDPSVYEDVKILLGNVGRNRSLRALVRYSIKHDEERERVSEPTGKSEQKIQAAADAP